MLSRSSWSYRQGWVDLTGLAYRPNAISQLRLSEVRLRLEPLPLPLAHLREQQATDTCMHAHQGPYGS